MRLAELLDEYEAQDVTGDPELWPSSSFAKLGEGLSVEYESERWPKLRSALKMKAHNDAKAKAALMAIADDLKAIERTAEIGGFSRFGNEYIKEFQAHATDVILSALVAGNPPRGMHLSGELPKMLSKCPLTTTEAILAMAKKIGMAVFRPSWLSPESLELASSRVREKIDLFLKLGDHLDVYVVAPVDHYSVERHVRSNEKGSVIAPEGWEQAFAAVDMMIPHLRMIDKSIEKLRETAEEIQERVNSLARKVERQAIVAAKIELPKTERFPVLSDPMLFAVRQGQDLTKFSYARVGPCWGPDIDEKLVRRMLA